MPLVWGPWSAKRFRLDKMRLGDLVRAYFTYYAIQIYLLLALGGAVLAVRRAESPGGPIFAALLMVLLYPLVEYCVHRYILHSRLLYRSPYTAKVWKRIHYDHHQNPHDLAVLFGALYTTLPVIALVTLPIGWLIAGEAGAAAAFATGCVIFSFYEFIHCIEHLPFKPKARWLRDLKRRHLAHHFHNEQGNYGITSNLWDHAFQTFYNLPAECPRSPTVFNLGYAGEERERYPWVASLSAADEEFAEARRRRASA